MEMLIGISLMIYVCWRSVNIYENYRRELKINFNVITQIISAFFMSYFLIKASIVFLIFVILHTIFALALGSFLYIIPGPEDFDKNRGKVIDGYWSYAITDTLICFACYILSIIGNAYV